MTPDEILRFMRFAERLKFTKRHSWLSNGDQESTAEHTWRMAVLAMLIHPHLKDPPDLDRTLRMILVHDIAEAAVGDIPVFSSERAGHQDAEEAAMRTIVEEYGDPVIFELAALWHEFNTQGTPEARLAYLCDKMECNMQHNEADMSTWIEEEYPHQFRLREICKDDPFLKELNGAIDKESSERIITEGKYDLDTILGKAEEIMARYKESNK